MKKLLYGFTAAALTLGVSGCETTGSMGAKSLEPSQPVVPATAELPPAERPEYRVGDLKVWLNEKGNEFASEITSVDEETVSAQFGGCLSTYVKDFGPSLKWENCGRKNKNSGTQKLLEQDGNLWPLQVGNTASWKFRGRNNKAYSWVATRKCSVEGTANVTVPAGSFDTYHVVCKDKWKKLEWHYAPQLGRTVTSRRTPQGGSKVKRRYAELVSFTPGT